MKNGWLATWLLMPGLAMADPAAPAVSDEALAGFLGSLKVEARLDVDVDGDRVPDVAYVASDANERVFGVISGAGPAGRLGERVLAEGRLSTGAQSAPALAFDKGVLKLDDITGDDTTTTSSCSYRFDKAQHRLRLESMAAETYSASLAHGAVRVHWDVRKGVRTVEQGEVVTLDTGEQVYVYGPETRSRLAAAPMYVEDAPQAAMLVSQIEAAGRVASASGVPIIAGPASEN